MFTRKKAPLAAATAFVVVGLAGCFGGGGDDPAPTTPTTPTTPTKVATAGAMVDGLVKGATVYCDANENGEGEATEVSTTTDPLGNYNFEDCKFPVVGTGGFNIDTGFAFTGVLKSPAGAKFMTPLTTLLTGTGLTTADLARLLGLPEGTDPTKVDPTKDVGLMKTTLAVQQVMAQLAATIQAAGGGSVNLGAIYAQVATSLAETLKSAPAGTTLISGSGLNVALLESAAKKAAAKASVTVSDADLKAVSAAIKSQSEQFLTAASLDDLVKKSTQLQNPNNPDIKIDPKAGSQFFALENDSITIDTKPVTLTELGSTAGVTLSSFDQIGVKVSVTGAPPVGTSAVAMTLVEEGGQGREMRVALDKANLSLSATGQLGLTIPSDAKVYLYGKKANGSVVTYGGPLGTAKKPLSFAAGNVLTIDYSAIVNRVKEASTSANEPTLTSFLQVKGTFKFTAVLSNFNLRKSNGDALTQVNLKVTEDSPAILGASIAGTITVN